jgi:hypothetical protein
MYVIDCSNFNQVQSANFTVGYPSSLGQPSVLPGGLADGFTLNFYNSIATLTISVTANNGVLPPSGVVAYILFPNVDTNNPAQVSLSGSVTGLTGFRFLETWYQDPNSPPKDPAPDPDEELNEQTGSGVQLAPQPNKIPAMQPDGSATGDRPKTNAVPPDIEKLTPLPAAGASQMPASSQAMTSKQQATGNGNAAGIQLLPLQRLPGVLDRFKSFEGERTEAALRHLFETEPTTLFHQKPAIAISDGERAVDITFQLASPGDNVDIMVLNDLRMLFFRYRDEGSVAELIVVPKAGTWKSSLMIKTANHLYEIPLTVTPPLNPDLVEAGVSEGKLSSRDYNGDGKVDYLDDYILMANRLSREEAINRRNNKNIVQPGP